MPKATKAGRQIARFDEGELWCTDDATPPVSPAGWYFRPSGGLVVWIGPFPTAEAAKAERYSGDPFAAARCRLDEWVRATAEPGSEPAATADDPAAGLRTGVDPATARPAATSYRRQTGVHRHAGPNVEKEDTLRQRVRPADRGLPDKHAGLDAAGVALAERLAGTTRDEAPAPNAPRSPVRVPDPTPRPPGQAADGPTGAGSHTIRPSLASLSPARQLAFGFGQGGEPTISDRGDARLPARPRRPSKRSERKPVEQEMLPFQVAPSGPAGGD